MKISDLLSLFYSKRTEISANFSRVLPLNETLTDRWEKAEYLGFGEGTSIHDSAHVYGNVQVGSNTWIGPFCILDGSCGLKIGSNCSISAGVQIYSHDTVQWAVSGGKKDYELEAVEIGSNCYLGPNCVIAKGVKLGDGCIVGANSLVIDSFGPGLKVAGNPAKVIGNSNL
jgi:acetyltransferase-like isoleucine patch superfamily enzyme